MPRVKIDRKQMIADWADLSLTVRQIAERQGVSPNAIHTLAKRIGLPSRAGMRPPSVPDTPEVRARYCAVDTDRAALAAELGVPLTTLRATASQRGWRVGPPKIEDTPELRELWDNDRLTLRDVARRLGVSDSGLLYAARRIGLPPRKGQKGAQADAAQGAAVPRLTSNVDPDDLRLLWEAGCLMDAIAEHLKVNMKSLRDHVRALGLPSRGHLTKAGRPTVAEVLARRRASLRVVPEAAPAASAADPVPRPPGWTEDRDAAVIASGGRYGEINALAARWGLDSTRVLARYHRLRAA